MDDVRELSNDQSKQYCEQVAGAIRAARLNQFYPNSRSLISNINAMHPTYHFGFHESLKVDASSGLPTYREWTVLQADQKVAEESVYKMGTLAELEQKAASHENPIFDKQLKKKKYYTELLKLKPAPIGDTTSRLREKGAGLTSFLVCLDKLDVNNLFLRYSIDLTQSSGDTVSLSADDVATSSDSMQSLVYRFASLDARYTFITLDAIAGINVEKVTKGTVGPIFFPGGKNIPSWLVDFVNAHGMVASFGIEMAAVDITDNSSNDPLFPESIEQKNAHFRLFRDRKFVVARDKVTVFRELLSKQGYKCIVYGL